MVGDAENCELIAPRILEKFGEAKDAKYDNAIVENMKPVENAPIVQHETADLTVIPVKPSSEQNGCHSPDLHKKELDQNNFPSVVDCKTKGCLEAKKDALEEELLTSEVVGDDLSDSSNSEFYIQNSESDGSSPTLHQPEATVHAPSVKPDLIMTEANENNGQEDIGNTSEKEEFATNPAEDIANESLTNDSEYTTTDEEASQSDDSTNQKVKKHSETAASATTETVTYIIRRVRIALLSTSSNEYVEEAEAIPSVTEEDKESCEDDDDEYEESATEKECGASEAGKTETEYETETSSSEDDESTLSCQGMKGRQYYDHYVKHKKKEFFALYPMGKVLLPRGFLLYFKASTRREVVKLKREDIRDALLALGAEISFIDYQRGNLSGWVRFDDTCEALKILSRMSNNTLLIKTVYMVFTKVSKKEETRYLAQVGKKMVQLRNNKNDFQNKVKRLNMEKKELAEQLTVDQRKQQQKNQS